jgi:D-galactarolactone cycloisomerase
MLPRNLSRRDALRATLLGGFGALSGAAPLAHPRFALAQPPAAANKPSALKITKVETFLLRHKLPRAIGVSIALSDVRQSLLVKITSDSGLVGWGETADIGGARAIIETKLKPVLLGQNPLDHRKLWRSLWGANFGDGRAVAGVDIALHDLRGKALGQSVAEMYGGRVRDKVLAYASAMNYTDGVRPEEQFPAEAAALARRGFRAMKIRTGRFEPRRDLAVLTKIREAVGPDVTLLTDGNGAFTLPQAVQFGKQLEKLDFYCFEEPLPQGLNYAGYDVLTDSLDICVAGGEVLDSRVSAREHIVKRSFDIIQPDVVLCGGVAEVLFIADMARLFSVQFLPHCWSGAIGIAATLQVLSLTADATHGFTSDQPMLEFDQAENPFREELITRPFAISKDGTVEIPTGPGLGIEIDEEVVKKYAVPH